MSVLPLSYYQKDDVVLLAKDLLGKFLFTKIDGHLTGGMIIETEAYAGPEDKASHAYGNRRTKRTEVMFHNGGIAYVYLCYGMHPLFNIVTNMEGIPHAVLIRGILPTEGIEIMEKRRNHKQPLSDGPAKLTQALGISLKHNGQTLLSSPIWIEDRQFFPKKIQATPRIGVSYAKEHALLPWRFCLKDRIPF